MFEVKRRLPFHRNLKNTADCSYFPGHKSYRKKSTIRGFIFQIKTSIPTDRLFSKTHDTFSTPENLEPNDFPAANIFLRKLQLHLQLILVVFLLSPIYLSNWTNFERSRNLTSKIVYNTYKSNVVSCLERCIARDVIFNTLLAFSLCNTVSFNRSQLFERKRETIEIVWNDFLITRHWKTEM